MINNPTWPCNYPEQKIVKKIEESPTFKSTYSNKIASKKYYINKGKKSIAEMLQHINNEIPEFFTQSEPTKPKEIHWNMKYV